MRIGKINVCVRARNVDNILHPLPSSPIPITCYTYVYLSFQTDQRCGQNSSWGWCWVRPFGPSRTQLLDMMGKTLRKFDVCFITLIYLFIFHTFDKKNPFLKLFTTISRFIAIKHTDDFIDNFFIKHIADRYNLLIQCTYVYVTVFILSCLQAQSTSNLT